MDKLWSQFDKGINQIRKLLTQERLDATIAKLESSANVGIPAAILVILAVGGAMSAKNDSSDAFEMALKMSGMVLGFGYLSHRFKEGCLTAGSNARSALSLQVYLDVLVLVGFVAALGAIFGGLNMAFKGRFEAAGGAIVVGFIALMATWHLCNQERLGVHIDTEAGADNDIVSMIALLVRLCLRMAAPVASIVVIIATAALIASVIGYFTYDPSDDAIRYMGNRYQGQIVGSMGMIVGGVAIPLGVYLSYVCISFSLALVENALSIKTIAANTAGGKPPALKLRKRAAAASEAAQASTPVSAATAGPEPSDPTSAG